jgi:hypothetical protein
VPESESAHAASQLHCDESNAGALAPSWPPTVRLLASPRCLLTNTALEAGFGAFVPGIRNAIYG